MTTLQVQPFVLRQGRWWPKLDQVRIDETLKGTLRIVEKVSGQGAVTLRWGQAYTLDLPDGTLPAQIPADYGRRGIVKNALLKHQYLQKLRSYTGLIRVFFAWEFTPVAEDGRWAYPKGLTLDSHHLMVLGSSLSLEERSLALAHEFGHALLGATHFNVKGNLMHRDLGGAGEALHPSQQDTFSAHAATVAGGVSIVPPP